MGFGPGYSTRPGQLQFVVPAQIRFRSARAFDTSIRTKPPNADARPLRSSVRLVVVQVARVVGFVIATTGGGSYSAVTRLLTFAVQVAFVPSHEFTPVQPTSFQPPGSAAGALRPTTVPFV